LASFREAQIVSLNVMAMADGTIVSDRGKPLHVSPQWVQASAFTLLRLPKSIPWQIAAQYARAI
jgi:hypothetical protein